MDQAIPEVVELALDKVFHSVQVDKIPFTPRRFKDRLQHFFQGWHVTVTTSAFIALAVLVINLAILAWAELSSLSVSDGVLTLFSGNCSHMQTIFTWSHVGINILSTMLLAASNTSCQVLSAPTRKEVDTAHRAGYWLDVGVSSFRNLRFVALKKLVIYSLLALSSVPLHLIYNSILFPTTTAYTNLATFVTADFLQGAPWDESTTIKSPGIRREHVGGVLKSLQRKAYRGDLVPLNNIDCVNELSSVFISKYRNFLVVVKGRRPLTSDIMFQASKKSPLNDEGMRWLCSGDWHSIMLHSGGRYSYRCHVLSAGTWNDTAKRDWYIYPAGGGIGDTGRNGEGALTVERCLAETAPELCTISISRLLLVAVIICNFFKFVCFLFVVRWADGLPLVTVGDCIDSFLRKPDTSTANLGPVSAVDVRDGIWNIDSDLVEEYWPSRTWCAKKYFWFAASGWKRWTVTGFFLLSVYVPAATGPMWAHTGAHSWGNIARMGTISENLIITFTARWGIPREVVFVNLPQLGLSFAYIFINNIITSCLQASEASDFAKQRKGLRVTARQNLQRSTYWLQVPYRYALPMMGYWIVLHWLTSQSLFLARMNIQPFIPSSTATSIINGCGYSPIPILIVIVFLGAMVVALYGIGFRRYPGNIPLMSGCTVAIAAACHAAQEEGEDMATMPLKYGVLTTPKVLDGVTYKRVGFSSREVEPLVEGEMYR